ncbi:hypothetical protein [Planococcus rifietoensis]|uniref:hypothetical protein n=1 Tax=Planococcus rifietoensis TaxID=200991 RepID=UPI00384C4CFE
MLFSKWTVYQAAALAGLIGLAVLAEFYSLDIGIALASGAISSMLIVLTFILLSTSLIHLFFVFHSKKKRALLVAFLVEQDERAVGTAARNFCHRVHFSWDVHSFK